MLRSFKLRCRAVASQVPRVLLLSLSARPARLSAVTIESSSKTKLKMSERILRVKRLGRVEYGAALALQKETESAVIAGEAPDTLLLLEHPHTLTLGRNATRERITTPQAVLDARGVTVFETNRGGKATYHGLGQIVGYPIINLSPDREDVHRYVRDIEETLIRALADFNIESFRIKGLTGVHTDKGKVAAIGLSYFNLIIACEGEPVTSMRDILGREISMSEVEDRIIARFSEVFEMSLEDRASEAARAAHEHQMTT